MARTGIYGIVNTATGKWYVGQAEDIERRWAKHLYELRTGTHHSEKLQRSYEKHREDAFLFFVLEECPVDLLDDREVFWIAEKNSFSNGYNMTSGGGGVRGWKMPEEARGKISSALKRNAYWRGKKQPEELNRRRSLALMGEKNHNFGRSPSEETREKLRKAHKGRQPPNKRKVRCIETGAIYESAKAAALLLGLDHSSLTKCCRGERELCGGCHWEVYRQ